VATPEQIERFETLQNSLIETLRSQFRVLSKSVEVSLGALLRTVINSADLIQMRPQIQAQFRVLNDFRNQLPEQLRELAETGAEMQDIGGLSAADLAAITALTAVVENQLASEITRFQTSITDSIIANSVAGTPIEDIIQQTGFEISGLMAESTDPTVRRLQRRLENLQESAGDPDEIAEVVRQLQGELGAITKGGNLRETVNRAATAAVIGFGAAYLMSRSRQRNIKRFQYAGGTIETSREFCVEHDGNIYTEEEIYQIWDDDWRGKEEGDPFIVRGGYNCRHFWVPVADETGEDNGEETN
jgi:BMFP domain-containing protein YqiC